MLRRGTSAKPVDLDAWREQCQSDDWDVHSLQGNPPRWIAVQFQDGTVDFGYATGLRTQFPSIVVTVRGSNLTVEVSAMTIVHCLREGRPVRI